MTMTEKCDEHSGVCKMVEYLSAENKTQWESIKNNQKILSGIKNWLMLLMGGIIAQLLLTIVDMATKIK